MGINLFDVSGKTAIITGGRRGIGLAFALALRDRGAQVAVIARSSDKGALPDDIGYMQSDLCLANSRRDLIKSVADKFLGGRLDILINNAAISIVKPALDYTPLIWNETIETNLTAPFELSQQAARIMAGQGSGKIIMLCSLSSFNGARNIVGYATTKHGLIGMIKCLSNELIPLGINVNGIAPGFIDTEMLSPLTTDALHLKEMLGRIPAGRLGRTDDLIGALLFLASDASRYVSGITIPVDGGWLGR